MAMRWSVVENLTALVIRLQITWVRRSGSPSTQTGVGVPVTSSRRRRPCSAGSVSSRARATTSRRSTRSRRSSIFPDAMRENVEQVVDHARQVRDLALDDATLPPLVRTVAPGHDLERSDDGRERIAQLVAEHGEELVLGTVGDLGVVQRVARFAEQADVVERQRGALRQLADQRAVLGAEAAPRVGLQRAHGADRPAARDQRHDAGSDDAEALGRRRESSGR
jgi:hypothetical protein